MKYPLSIILGVLTTVLGFTTIAQANLNRINGSSQSRLVASQPPSTSVLTMNSLEISVYDQINTYRQSLNLAPLVIDPVACAQARAHSQEMARTGNLVHRVESAAQKIATPSIAENIATNQGSTQPDLIAVQGWLASPEHQRNAIGRYNVTGIGVAKNAQGEYYLTQIFIYKRM